MRSAGCAIDPLGKGLRPPPWARPWRPSMAYARRRSGGRVSCGEVLFGRQARLPVPQGENGSAAGAGGASQASGGRLHGGTSASSGGGGASSSPVEGHGFPPPLPEPGGRRGGRSPPQAVDLRHLRPTWSNRAGAGRSVQRSFTSMNSSYGCHHCPGDKQVSAGPPGQRQDGIWQNISKKAGFSLA